MPRDENLPELACDALIGLSRLSRDALSLFPDWLPRTILVVISASLLWLSIKFAKRSLGRSRGPFVDGMYIPDLALQMIGSHGDLARIVRHSGYRQLHRNLVLDALLFVPLYVLAILGATLLLVGMPLPCRALAFSPWAGAVMFLTVVAAILDWLENASLGKALRLDANGDSKNEAKKQMLLGRGHRQAIVKFVCLGIAVGVLALHAWSPTGLANLPGAAGYGLSFLFCLASLAMLVCIRFPRFLEPGTAMTGLGITLLFTICAW